jgi:hypothetical protein
MKGKKLAGTRRRKTAERQSFHKCLVVEDAVALCHGTDGQVGIVRAARQKIQHHGAAE